MFKDYILFAQSGDSGVQSDFIRDGESVSGLDTSKLYDFIRLRQRTAPKSDNNHFWEPISIKPINANSTLSIYKDNLGNIMIQSHFLDKDELGRRIAYKFCTKYSYPTSIIRTLKRATKLAHRTPNSDDMRVLKQLKSSHIAFRHIAIVFIIIILTLIFFYVKWKNS